MNYGTWFFNAAYVSPLTLLYMGWTIFSTSRFFSQVFTTDQWFDGAKTGFELANFGSKGQYLYDDTLLPDLLLGDKNCPPPVQNRVKEYFDEVGVVKRGLHSPITPNKTPR